MRTIIHIIFLSFAVYTSYAQVDYQSFLTPPQEYRPWVYWMWVNGNVDKESVTKDLEAMHAVGLGGTMVLDVDQSTPQNSMQHMDEIWQDVFTHAVKESKRLGMQISTNNGPGYWGSGGKWITPEMGMQWVVSSETYIHGGKRWKGTLPSPGIGDDYRDIAVIAIGVIDTVPEKRYNIPDFALKSGQFPGNEGDVNYACASMTLQAIGWPGHDRYLGYRGTESGSFRTPVSGAAIIPADKVINLTDFITRDGYLEWDVPEGEWTIIRFGHQFTGSCIGPVIPEVRGPETDKLNKEVTRFHFREMVKQLNDKAGPEAKGVLVSTHIDSWEGGGQNWTPGMDKEFRERRGYDIIPYLPILTGRILGSLEETERFLFDLRTTISELFVENYVREFQELANKEGLQLSFECYTTPGNDLDAANYVDVPTAEFWVPIEWTPDFHATIKSMASAAHLNHRPIVAAEALTASDHERWLYHPAKWKHLVDEAFCGGINRMIFHRYSAQYFDYQGPGMQMGPWGQHYERTNTWWYFSTPWHTYISRCQYMLTQGVFRADILTLMPEEPMYRFQETYIDGYDYDVLGTETFKRLEVKDGDLLMPGRPPYKLLLLSHNGSMTLTTLQKIKMLVENGAAILGDRPLHTPGLANYEEEKSEFNWLTDEIWGPAHTIRLQERRLGKGTVFRGISPGEALQRLGIRKDFQSDQPLRYIHRTNENSEIYFVANTTEREFMALSTFRTTGDHIEIWDAETGEQYAATPLDTGTGESTTILLPFTGQKSYFVIFNPQTENPAVRTFPLRHQPYNIIPIEGDWDVYFPPNWGAPSKVTFPKLISWSEHAEEDIRYFSGTARYSKEIQVGKELLNSKMPVILDLGEVNVMARVIVNGKEAGTGWRTPFRFDISQAIKEGKNRLEIEVVNLWPNRLIGDERFPDDSHFTPHGYIEKWPDWIVKNRKRPSKRKAFVTRRLWHADDNLIPSGLIGPVTLYNLFTE